jgi:cytochrome P450/NADPH-cytochrome P450 reductase
MNGIFSRSLCVYYCDISKFGHMEYYNMIAETTSLEAIPQPPLKPIVGNLLDVDIYTPVQGMVRLAHKYGPIYRLSLQDRSLIVVSGFDLVDDLCDEKRFDKRVWAPLRNVRQFAGDGLFTSRTREPNWHKAHNILLPTFSQRAMQGYHEAMLDIAEQLMEKWSRLNADEEIDVPTDMTRLTLDTIGLCGFDYRLNSFYRENSHPFVQSMSRALGESMLRLQRLPIANKMLVHKRRQFQADIEYMNSMVDTIIKERKASRQDLSQKKDLLSYMLTQTDKQTGERLDDQNIRYQIITFLIAGHETTSGLLSFAIYFLLKHPEVLEKAYEEVDRVLGPDPTLLPTYAQVNKLTYIQQILKESLRLWPTAPMFALYPYEDAVIGDKYQVTTRDEIAVLVPMLHRDKRVWGDDAEEFKPERFSPEREAALPPNAYKPFGNGQRACIGRQFAMQEATLVMGMLLQRFKLIDHTNYKLKIRETLTLKPDNFKIKVRRREDSERKIVVGQVQTVQKPVRKTEAVQPVAKHHTPLLVLFGSNMGTAEDLAHQVAEDGERKGFDTTVAPLDDYTNKLPKDGAVIIITASYNGTPPDNASAFCQWLRSGNIPADALKDVRYSVFGCGNRDWSATFQAIPRLIDTSLSEFGATRIYPRGEGDAKDDFDGQFQSWYASLWETLAENLSINMGTLGSKTQEPQYEVEIVSGQQTHPVITIFGAQLMCIVSNTELYATPPTPAGEHSARHIEIELPQNVSYQAGDHLGIVPSNSAAQVKRVLTRFGFDEQTKIRLHKNTERKSQLPVDEIVTAANLLTNYVELQDVATRKQIATLASYTQCPPEKQKLAALAGNDEASNTLYRTEVLEKHKSLIDLLEECPACEVPFSVYLEMLPIIRPRYYSISSSSLHDERHCSITVARVAGPARSGHGIYEGVCSNFLAHMPEGSTIYAFIQNSKTPFRLPEDPATPLIMVGPGTGLAPFRGFLQERAALQKQGKTVGKALLFFGCRHPEQDFLYEQELKGFAEQGITDLYVAFSRLPDQPRTYVQHRIREHKEEVWQLIEHGASIYICGDASSMAPDVRKTISEIYQEKVAKSEQEANQWINDMISQQRYQVDVWSGN